MNKLTRLMTVAVVMLIAACASTGTKVTEQQATQFKPGVATEADVVKALGEPQMRTRTSDGELILSYTYAHAQIKAASMIPVVGLFAGGATSHTTTEQFRFRDGKLTSIDGGEGQADVRTGALGNANSTK